MRYLIDTNIFIYLATDNDLINRDVSKILGEYEKKKGLN